jgi:mRNA interferase RelE/StbE
MIYRRTETFYKAAQALPKSIQDKVKKAYAFFRENPQHPSLGVKKLKGYEGIWEGRIDQFYRFTFEYQKDSETGETICLFRNIGPHSIIKTSP